MGVLPFREPLSSVYLPGQNVQLDGYIRVSRVAGRGGETFISPDLQREQIEGWAKVRGVEIATIHTDLDQTGGKLRRPGLDAFMERLKTGQTGGIAVARLDRLSRAGVADALRLVEEIHEAGGELAALDLGIDPTTPFGEFALTIMLGLARMQRRNIAESWASSRERAVGRGVHVASRTPTGYEAGEDGRLLPSPAAPFVAQVFEARAGGASWRECARILEDAGVATPYGGVQWANRSLSHLTSNRAYLGEARSGAFVNPDAHPAIVSAEVWNRAQVPRGRRFAPTGGALLSGLVRCAGCRFVLKADKQRGRDGGQLRIYRCRGRHSMGTCGSRAAVLGSVVEPWVEAEFFAHVGAERLRGAAATDELKAALADQAEAEAELDAYRDSGAAAILGDRFAEGLRVRAEAVAEADKLVGVLSERLGLVEVVAEIEAEWPGMSVSERREVLHGAIDAVFLRSVGQVNVPISERALILWRGEGPDDLPGPGRRGIAPRPFEW